MTPYTSTTDLSKIEFVEYLQKIERDTGIPLLDTDEFHYDKVEPVEQPYPEENNNLANKFQ